MSQTVEKKRWFLQFAFSLFLHFIGLLRRHAVTKKMVFFCAPSILHANNLCSFKDIEMLKDIGMGKLGPLMNRHGTQGTMFAQDRQDTVFALPLAGLGLALADLLDEFV